MDLIVLKTYHNEEGDLLSFDWKNTITSVTGNYEMSSPYFRCIKNDSVNIQQFYEVLRNALIAIDS